MSKRTTRTAELEDRAETIVAAFDESGIEALAAIDVSTVTSHMAKLRGFDVPLDEAERTAVRHVVNDADVDESELSGAVADLAGFGGGPITFSRTLVGDIAQADEWVDLVVDVVDLWEPTHDSIAQVGLLGDESGEIKFVKWRDAGLPELAEGETYRIESGVTDEYEGRYSVNLNNATDIEPADEDISRTVTLTGALVDIQPGSGLIKRCPEEECTRVLENGRCPQDGTVDGEFDLRIKAIIDDGRHAVNALFDQAATEALTGISITEATEMAMDALSTEVVLEAFEDDLVGRFFQVSGDVVGEYVLVEDATRVGPDQAPPVSGFADAVVERVVSPREPARRVLAHSFNAATHTFEESDDDRAPVYALLPTGVAMNRVVAVGTLTETADVGSETEYWQGRVVDPTGTFFVYAGQYQPDVASQLRHMEPPAYVAVVGKPRTYETDEGATHVSIRPESLQVVDSATRDRWLHEAASQTRQRLSAFADGDSPYGETAREMYGDDLEAVETAVSDVEADLASGEGGGAPGADGEYPCTDCEETFDSEHGLATHSGKQHADAGAD